MFAFVVLRDRSAPTDLAGGNEPTLLLGLVSTDLAPTATLRYGDREVEVVTEGYEWCEVAGDACTGTIGDWAFYPPVSEYLVVPPGTPIGVTGDGAVGEFTVTDPDDEPVPGATNLAVPNVNGRFVFHITGEFERGQGSFFFGVQAIDAPSSAPDVLRIDCLTGRTNTAIVRTQADGLHVVATGTEGFDAFGIVTPEGTPPESFFGAGGDLPADGASGWPIDPGHWEIGCAVDGRPVEAGDQTVAFELVDPDDHWASIEIACPALASETFTSSIPASVPHEEAAAQLFGGLAPMDRIRGAGYGADDFIRGPTYVVEREGESVARLQLLGSTPPDTPTWTGEFVACPDSGIELAQAEPSPSPAPEIPDVLLMRCEGLGPAVDAPRVRLQPDGLHVEATNIAEATVVEVRSDGSIASTTPFHSVTERFVADVAPGIVLIGCRVQDDAGDVVGGPEEFPDAYVEITVLPAGG
jgi:hypothetical protein